MGVLAGVDEEGMIASWLKVVGFAAKLGGPRHAWYMPRITYPSLVQPCGCIL